MMHLGNRRALIDADILQYELGFASEVAWRYKLAETGEEPSGPPPWDFVAPMVEARIQHILQETGATDPLLLFTGARNFRNYIAVSHPYKKREGRKPYHHANIKAYLKSLHPWFEEEGLEADDLQSLFLTAQPDKWICCSRDKDLRQTPGWHYGWEVHNQPSFGPELVDDFGYIHLSEGKSRKLTGVGTKFLYAQMLMGDGVDTIIGIPKMGDVGAFKIINPCTTLQELEEAVLGAFTTFYGDQGRDMMLENARLVYLIRKREGDWIKLYTLPSTAYEEWMHIGTGQIQQRSMD